MVSSLVLHHRVFHPFLPALPYTERASISWSSDNIPILLNSNNVVDDVATFAESLNTLEDSSNALYQIALQLDSDTSESTWDYSSVKLCHLQSVSAETVILQATPQPDSQHYALNYFVSPIPHDGSCPRSKNPKPMAAVLKEFASNLDKLNSTLLIHRPSTPLLPQLRAPPSLTAEGEVVKPIPEKSFIQKYWVYIVAVLFVLLATGGSDEPRNGGTAAS